MAGIYVHIPFCKSRCIYCDFFSTTSLEERERYVRAVCQEIETRKDYLPVSGDGMSENIIPGKHTIDTVYFGGGTPTQLSAKQIKTIMECLHHVYDIKGNAEITIEGNPDDLTRGMLDSLRDIGFNRLSMGIQTFSNERLRFLCRRHTAEAAVRAVENAKCAGFGNISVDLMYGFPNETLQEWESDVRTAIELNVQHLSAYSLMYEEGTALYRMRESGKVKEADEELSLSMYETLMDKLREAGFEHYEISNFCRPGFRSHHNSSYWKGIPYIGVGAAAHSFDGQSRQWNPSSLSLYLAGMEHGNLDVEREELTEWQKYDECIMTGLRTADGVDLNALRHHFGDLRLGYCLGCAENYLHDGLLELVSSPYSLRLTRKGIFVSDSVMADLMSDEGE
ncbi:MAG: radical SAM family heme chaperone HemW [Bacteroides sp.]|nr:radical SAM family heme chaperone HemW [Roseburia sp.]MCM1346260.1 radical SAM family heme chaperone HemW [Bacteroides sp.]MCM1420868.1 radical SAM family heme chaperone HemW [Bacteroides sp.]